MTPAYRVGEQGPELFVPGTAAAKTPLVSVITATIPGRENYLAECKRSVAAQTFPSFEHLVTLDEHREGCSVMCNRMVAQARGEWLFLLADDDLMLPGCLATHLAHSQHADIVYAPPLVWGLHDPWWFFQSPPVIPATALIRRELWLELGGYDERAVREEDRGLWVKAVEANKRFVRADTEPTWIYRLHGGNKSMPGLKVAA